MSMMLRLSSGSFTAPRALPLGWSRGTGTVGSGCGIGLVSGSPFQVPCHPTKYHVILTTSHPSQGRIPGWYRPLRFAQGETVGKLTLRDQLLGTDRGAPGGSPSESSVRTSLRPLHRVPGPGVKGPVGEEDQKEIVRRVDPELGAREPGVAVRRLGDQRAIDTRLLLVQLGESQPSSRVPPRGLPGEELAYGGRIHPPPRRCHPLAGARLGQTAPDPGRSVNTPACPATPKAAASGRSSPPDNTPPDARGRDPPLEPGGRTETGLGHAERTEDLGLRKTVEAGAGDRFDEQTQEHRVQVAVLGGVAGDWNSGCAYSRLTIRCGSAPPS